MLVLLELEVYPSVLRRFHLTGVEITAAATLRISNPHRGFNFVRVLI